MTVIQQAVLPVIAPPPVPPATVPHEPHIVIHDVSFTFYKAFVAAVGHRPALRLTYDGESLEIMTVSPLHEFYKKIIGNLVLIVAMELAISIKSGGGFTFGREDLEKGLEPDECYYVQHAADVRGRKEIDFSRDPVPDLAVEVEVSRNVLDRMSIYADFGVPELWRFDGSTLRSYRLNAAKTYEPSEQSLSFPFLPLAELVPFVLRATDGDEIAVMQEFRAWVRERILPSWPGTTGR